MEKEINEIIKKLKSIKKSTPKDMIDKDHLIALLESGPAFDWLEESLIKHNVKSVLPLLDDCDDKFLRVIIEWVREVYAWGGNW